MNSTFTDFATSAPAKLRRTVSQKKQAEILTENLGVPLQSCITSLCKARDIANVFDAMVTFSGHYLAYKQVMQQTIEDPNFEDNFDAEQVLLFSRLLKMCLSHMVHLAYISNRRLTSLFCSIILHSYG